LNSQAGCQKVGHVPELEKEREIAHRRGWGELR
jgi:hypothetical protein